MNESRPKVLHQNAIRIQTLSFEYNTRGVSFLNLCYSMKIKKINRHKVIHILKLQIFRVE